MFKSKQEELFNQWNLHSLVLKNIGSVIQNDFNKLKPTKDQLIEMKEQFEESYADILYHIKDDANNIIDFINKEIENNES